MGGTCIFLVEGEIVVLVMKETKSGVDDTIDGRFIFGYTDIIFNR